jgi:hypothetical protein
MAYYKMKRGLFFYGTGQYKIKRGLFFYGIIQNEEGPLFLWHNTK